MDTVLPDVSTTELSPSLSALEWVGMQGIDLPVTVAEPGYRRALHARADVQVDLPAPHVKGIHMSRLYRLLDGLADRTDLTPVSIHEVLRAMVVSHHDCESRSARLTLSFDLLVRRPALVSEDLAGWKAYPVEIRATLRQGHYALEAQVTVAYSSTCPCSAALSRQLVEQAFLDTFSGRDRLAPATVAAWLRQNATLATPHSQRSQACVTVCVAPVAPNLGLLPLIDCIEQALSTPVQTAVKRADEQAFAALNGGNLMFVEDAARRIQAALRGRFDQPRVHVRHLESLHPHDAAAWAENPASEAL
ncbi:GTP cyclohydrolase I FolE2 [Bordetella genomosp. 10]|uniref:GTP cyclohydrolase FolE2 n=1 Tax=Bordetella genomosp. 10 TaxID=1416804 RepID=A0A261S0U8_9BORD|nr:GTP cyclohydrolase FolE2 [Bordetella genomosp. 10]OZI30968.1 GTP cyclohydrolase I FolE2 [Bordetella genomosp. 10]